MVVSGSGVTRHEQSETESVRRNTNEKQLNGRRRQTWGQSQINVENIGTPLRDTEKNVQRLRYMIHIPIFMFTVPVTCFPSSLSWKDRGGLGSYHRSNIKPLTSKWLISSQGRAVALGSIFQSCSASCSASSTWKSFPLWDLVTWNHSQSVCNTVMCNCADLWKMRSLQQYRLLWSHLLLPHS